jgi:hypothetical protein
MRSVQDLSQFRSVGLSANPDIVRADRCRQTELGRVCHHHLGPVAFRNTVFSLHNIQREPDSLQSCSP